MQQRFRKDGGVGRVPGDRYDLRIPARKRVFIMVGMRLGRRLALVFGRLAVGDQLLLQLRAVLVHKRDRVLVDRTCIDRRVGHCAGDCGQIVRQSVYDPVFILPSRKGIGILRSRGLGRRFALVDRRFAYRDRTALKLRAVLVYKRDREYDLPPLCVESQADVFGSCIEVCAVGIRRSAAVGFGVPAREFISVTNENIRGDRRSIV